MTNTKSKISQFFKNWNGFILMIPMFLFFVASKTAIFIFTEGQEQGYFWSHLNIISFGALRLAFAEGLASAFLFFNSRDAFKMIFTKLTKEQVQECSFSREHAIRLYCHYLLAAALLMAFL